MMKSRWAIAETISDQAVTQTANPPLLFETALEYLVESMNHELAVSAVSQYEYARLDEEHTRLQTIYKQHSTAYPKDLKSHIWKALANGFIRLRWLKLSRWCSVKIKSVHLTFFLPENEEVAVGDLLDGITLQIYYLRRHDVKPQAIIAHPDLVRKLESLEAFGIDGGSYGQAYSQVFGLRVIKEPTMKTLSAYVV